MEIKVTHLVTEHDCYDYSDSIAHSGREDIGKVTWGNAVECAEESPLVGPEGQDALRAWIREFGAWDDEEVAAMSDTETNALLLQFIAGDITEMESFDTYQDYLDACERGSVGGRLSKGDDGEWYFYVGM